MVHIILSFSLSLCACFFFIVPFVRSNRNDNNIFCLLYFIDYTTMLQSNLYSKCVKHVSRNTQIVHNRVSILNMLYATESIILFFCVNFVWFFLICLFFWLFLVKIRNYFALGKNYLRMGLIVIDLQI